MDASIITIGSELLIGQIIDTNSAYIGEALNTIGIEVVLRLSVRDDNKDIQDALKVATEHSDIVIITGGLGPTKDDITKYSIASFLNREMYFDESIFDKIQRFFSNLGKQITDSHRRQCFFPEGTEFLKNTMGTAPGMLLTKDDTRYYALPGVPYEMKYILDTHIIPSLAELSDDTIYHKTILTSGKGETELEKMIGHIEDSLPPYISLAYLPSLGRVRLRLTGKGKNRDNLIREITDYKEQIERLIQSSIVGYDKESTVANLGKLLEDRGLMLATAESCTGGQMASMLTANPGASAYYAGSVVTYSNESKTKLLLVNQETLKKFGAVSEQTVKEMAKGALNNIPCNIAISVSGIAGPTGGTSEKPVGTVWMAIGYKDIIKTQKLQLNRNRAQNIEYTCHAGFNMIREFIKDI